MSFCQGPNPEHHEPIAIVGTAMRLPGDVRSADALWDLILSKRDASCEIPKSRFDIDKFYNPTRPQHSLFTRRGYFLQENPLCFDNEFFSPDPNAYINRDPQQRALLEVVWECLENAGATDWEGQDVGCYVGAFGEDWIERSLKDEQNIAWDYPIAVGGFALSNTVSFVYDFRGPSMTIQTGCSASMVALHEACQALRLGSCTTAIVAGANLMWLPTMSIAMGQYGVLSPDGLCKTFDAKADGYGRGEGINALYLKPLQAALSDHDTIHAVIRATATNQDGRTPVMSYPSAGAQESLIRRAYRDAGIADIANTPLFECHGTGTMAGDTTEGTVVAKLADRRGVFLGAVKPNLGHAEGASGINSILKSILALKHRTIPPNIHFNSPNPDIPFADGHLKVPLDPIPWPRDRPERISVNSFGIGGSNAHVVLESAEYYMKSHNIPRHDENILATDDSQILFISAKTKAALDTRIQELTAYVNGAGRDSLLSDLSHTLAIRRRHFDHRAFAIARPGATLEEQGFNRSCCTVPVPGVSFVFTGQGAQWPGMGETLLATDAGFAADIQNMDRVLQGLRDAPLWSMQDELRKVHQASRVHEAELSQPLCAAIGIGLVNILARWGIKPASVVGHSSGEIVAAYAAGAITMRSAIIVAYYRGKHAQSLDGRGAMAAVTMSTEEIRSYLVEGVVIACHNAPNSVTISGNPEGIKSVLARIQTDRPSSLCRKLRVQTAYHSDHMRNIAEEYEASISPHMEYGQLACPMFSTVSAQGITDSLTLNETYWRRNLELPVRFTEGVQSLIRFHHAKAATSVPLAFVEIGPHCSLSSPLRQICQAERTVFHYIPTLTRYDHDIRSQLLSTAGHVHNLGAPTNLAVLAGKGRLLSDLPLYPWDHAEPLVRDERLLNNWRYSHFPRHEVLGCRVLESSDSEPSWRNLLRLQDVPWLCDHVLQGTVVFPGAGYIAMAGEAIRQTRQTNAYRVKNVLFKSTLILTEHQPVEMITTLTPIKYNDHMDSDWYSFTIMAHDGATWTRVCQGSVLGCAEMTSSPAPHESYPRLVNSTQWYQILKDGGLEYGPTFRGLRNISTHPIDHIASATIKEAQGISKTQYTLHPIHIDQCIQLLSVASANGLQRPENNLAIPISVEEAYFGGSENEMGITTWQADHTAGGVAGSLTLSSKDKLLASITRVVCFAVQDEQEPPNTTIPITSELRWQPDIHSIPSSVLLEPTRPIPPERKALLDRGLVVTILSIFETAERLASVEPISAHHLKWKNWVVNKAEELRGNPELIPKSIRNDARDRDLRRKIMEDLYARKDQDPLFTSLLLSITNHSAAIVTGEVLSLELMMADKALERLYKLMNNRSDWRTFLTLLGHQNPRMRVLEIGAGTGGSTQLALQWLHSPEGTRMYSEYVFTDISPGFLSSAQETFSSYRGLSFKVLDITRDPTEQGFEAHSFDLIICANVLHATPCLVETLKHVHALLKPTGRLLLQELSPDFLLTTFIMGTLPGWWLGEKDGRVERPTVSPQRWEADLLTAGFNGFEAYAYDLDPPYHMNINMLAVPSTVSDQSQSLSEKVHLITRNKNQDPWIEQLMVQYCKEGFVVDCKSLDSITPIEDGLAVFALDRDTPFLYDMSSEEYEMFQHHLNGLINTQALWITQTAQLHPKDPRYGMAQGFARSLRREFAIDLSILEVDDFDTQAAALAVTISRRVQLSRSKTDDGCPYDSEFLVRNGTIYTSRCHWVPPVQPTANSSHPELPRKLSMKSAGLLSSMHWTQGNECGDLAEDGVEIDIRYVGLNFRDMMVAMGLFGNIDEVGIEASGVVRRIGSSVSGLQAGDKVAFMGKGMMRTRTQVQQQHCQKLGEEISLSDGAACFIAFATAIHSLINLGSLQAGQSVLIHSACGGFGLAAIQVCQAIGAEVYATVGTDEKVRYLMAHYSIPRERIFCSRDVTFRAGIMEATSGRGVDLVLNSLAGELLHASWECVAEHGCMIELGKRDILTNGVLSLGPFGKNRAFFGVDLFGLAASCPARIQRLAVDVREWLVTGRVSPIRPVNTFDAENILDAFHYMEKGHHYGKILIRMPSDPAHLPCRGVFDTFSLSSDVSYLLVGGLGGLGRAASTWMVQNGARNLVVLSPSATSEKHKPFIHELEAQCCNVICVAGDVANIDDVNNAVSRCPKPLAGVIHMSMVIKDRTFANMSHGEWTECLAPKVQGTWNLHHAVRDHTLQFFVLFGSLASVCGNGGQTNYAAANSFLSSFSQFRHSQGLPCSVISYGPVARIGFVANNDALNQQSGLTPLRLLKEHEVMEALRSAILNQHPYNRSSTPELKSPESMVGLLHKGPITSDATGIFWHRADARFSMYYNLQDDNNQKVTETTADSGLRDLLSEIDNRPTILQDKSVGLTIMRQVSKVIARNLGDGELSDDQIAGIAIDSLVAIEARNWARKNMRLDIPMSALSKVKNVGTLADYLVEALKAKYAQGKREKS